MFKKGQVETLGLVVIVLLLAFLGLLFLKYSGSDKVGSDDKFLAIKANNFLNAIKYLSVEGNNFEYFLADCCVGNSDSCGIVQEVVLSSMAYLDEGSYFGLTCFNGQESNFGDANCEIGLSSETFVLLSGDRITLKICRN